MNKINQYFFSHGRTALKFGLKSLNIKKGHEVLVPDYNCIEFYEPFLDMDIIPKDYKTTERLEIDFVDLKKKISKKTKAILVVHYFGVIQEFSKIISLCKKNKLFLIQDNAHGFGFDYQNKLFYNFDIIFSSPRKTFNLNSGGILYLRNFEINNKYYSLKDYPNSQFNEFKKNLIYNVRKNFPFLRRIMKKQPKYWLQNNLRQTKLFEFKIDKFSKNIIEKKDLSVLIRDRRKVYNLWSKLLKNKKNIEPLFNQLTEGSCPLYFPTMTKDFNETKKWFNWGWNNSIDVKSWPNLPLKNIKARPELIKRWERIVLFPTNLVINTETLQEKLKL